MKARRWIGSVGALSTENYGESARHEPTELTEPQFCQFCQFGFGEQPKILLVDEPLGAAGTNGAPAVEGADVKGLV